MSASAAPPSPLACDGDVGIPTQFVWPKEEKQDLRTEEVIVPVVDLRGFLSGDPDATTEATKAVDSACTKHGFFQIINHGVPLALVAAVHRATDAFFSSPTAVKEAVQRKVGESWGYSHGYKGRFSSKLPWKETFSFRFASATLTSPHMVQDYFVDVLGHDFQQTGLVYLLSIPNYYFKFSTLFSTCMGIVIST